MILCILASGTTAASWSASLSEFDAITGTGSIVAAASPTLTGTPLSTTAAVDTNTTQIATTAFVLAQASSTTPVVAGTGTVGTSTRYTRQDHIHPAETPTGVVNPFAGLTTPSGWLLCDGSAVSRTTYATLFSSLSVSKGTFTVTIATPAVFTNTAHALVTGSQVYLTTTGALPTGLTINTNYFIVSTGANTFNLATTYANATAVTPVVIATSGTQSGTHTLTYAPYGVGSSTTFNLPDLRGRVVAGLDNMGGTDAARLDIANSSGSVTGTQYVTLTAAQSGLPGHGHTASSGNDNTDHSHQYYRDTYFSSGLGGGGSPVAYFESLVSSGGRSANHQHAITVDAIAAASAASAHEIMQPTMVMNYIIKT
jgi:microcystin-dependent protein